MGLNERQGLTWALACQFELYKLIEVLKTLVASQLIVVCLDQALYESSELLGFQFHER
jgi:hypothetical protein